MGTVARVGLAVWSELSEVRAHPRTSSPGAQMPGSSLSLVPKFPGFHTGLPTLFSKGGSTTYCWSRENEDISQKGNSVPPLNWKPPQPLGRAVPVLFGAGFCPRPCLWAAGPLMSSQVGADVGSGAADVPCSSLVYPSFIVGFNNSIYWVPFWVKKHFAFWSSTSSLNKHTHTSNTSTPSEKKKKSLSVLLRKGGYSLEHPGAPSGELRFCSHGCDSGCHSPVTDTVVAPSRCILHLLSRHALLPHSCSLRKKRRFCWPVCGQDRGLPVSAHTCVLTEWDLTAVKPLLCGRQRHHHLHPWDILPGAPRLSSEHQGTRRLSCRPWWQSGQQVRHRHAHNCAQQERALVYRRRPRH